MNKKTIILLITVVVILLAGVGVAVIFLYSDTSNHKQTSSVSVSDSRTGLMQAVPSDAVALVHFDELLSMVSAVAGSKSSAAFMKDYGFGKFLAALDAAFSNKEIKSLKYSNSLLSFHYEGSLVPLLIVDICKSNSELPDDVSVITGLASKSGLEISVTDCSGIAGSNSYLSKRKILSVSPSAALLKSSERHISQSVSVLDHDEFQSAVSQNRGIGQLYISNANAGKLIADIFSTKYKKYADFSKRFSDWMVLSFDDLSESRLSMSGGLFSREGNDKFLNVFSRVASGNSTVASVLPSYTVSAFSIPLNDVAKYLDSYSKYVDTKVGETKYLAVQKELRTKTGVEPKRWAELLGLQEVASAWFYVGDSLEGVLLLRPGNQDVNTIFDGISVESIRKYVPAVHDFKYSGFASSLFGSLFSMPDESKFTFVNGWIIVGSEIAINEYVSGMALENSLASYMAGASLDSRMDGRNIHFWGYWSVAENMKIIDETFRKNYSSALKSAFSDVTFAPAVLRIGSAKEYNTLTFTMDMVSDIKSNAPVFERDTVVTVPEGPFMVKNSGTGKMNKFYQNSNMFLCLEDENGKGLWGASFSTPICGRAGTVDYFANGKLQILFASGSKIYLIDRLGRFVKPFPVDLGKEVLIGPDIYDFNGTRKYNIMVLHKDNTVEMYNLQGRKPSSWKGIAPKETVKDLPELVSVDGKSYWVVRTSIQTLIYPFYGGESLTVFDGNKKLRPDSGVVPVKGGVEVTRYDGKKVTIELK